MPRTAIDRRRLGLIALALAASAAASAQTGPAAGAAALATCSNTGCHGSADPVVAGEAWRASAWTWTTRDPHADAYRVLFRHESRAMVRKLAGDAGLDADAYRRFVDERCAACHASARGSWPGEAVAEAELARGVSCDGCHGEPTGWLDDHFAASPPEKSRRTAAADGWTETNPAYGLADLGDHATAARVCAECHVGSSEASGGVRRDVNHDLLAAGHPRLAFEYTSHRANLPRHWDEPSEAPDAGERAGVWAIGQAVSAEAAIDLLVERTHAGPWPEFAEYDCSGCHHGLATTDRRAADWGVASSLYDWGGWYFALVDAEGAADLRAEIGRPLPDADEVRALATRVGKTLRTGIASRPPAELVSEPAGGAPLAWDAAVQVYLRKAHALGVASDEAAAERRRLAEAFRVLEPAPSTNGPVWLNYDPEPVRSALEALQSESEPPR